MNERLKQEIKNLEKNETDSVLEYICEKDTDINLSKDLLFRKSVEFGNKEIFDILIKREDIDIDACNGKSLIEAVTWNREEMIIALLNSDRVNPKGRTFKAYRSALSNCSETIIELFEEKIYKTEIKEHERLEIIRSFVIANSYEKFVKAIENESKITKKQYKSILSSVVTKLDIRFLKYFIGKNKKLDIVPMGKLYQMVKKTHSQKNHLNLIINNMEEKDFGYGNECIVRNIVKQKVFEDFKLVIAKYDFDFSLFDNKILKEALKKKVSEDFIKSIIYHKSLINSLNEEWYIKNEELILDHPNNSILRNYIIYRKKFESF